MNVRLNLKTQFEKLSIDDLASKLDFYANKPLELTVIQEVLGEKIGALADQMKLPAVEKEDAGDATSCPAPITIPSGAAFESAVSRDINSTEKHTDVIPTSCKPSPAPRWIPDHVPAVPAADVIGAAPIHSDGTQSNTFVGEPVPGLMFVNPGRQEGRAVHIPLASEVLEK